MLNDLLAKLPIDVLRQVEVEDDKITIPTKIDSNEFYKSLKDEIESTDTFSPEKAIYLASTHQPQRRKSISELLVRGR